MNLPTRHLRADALAGLSLAGLLIPEAVAYAAIAGLAPQAGIVALLAGLSIYGLLGGSRFAIVSATSSSAAVLLAAQNSLAAPDLATRAALAAGLVLIVGVFFLVAALARLGGMVSSLVAQPVLRGFTIGLAATIVLKQLFVAFVPGAAAGDFVDLLPDLWLRRADWHWPSLWLTLASLVWLGALRRFPRVPSALLLIAVTVLLGQAGVLAHLGIDTVGRIDVQFAAPSVPFFSRHQWLQLMELGFALALILYAESIGSIRALALRQDEHASPNRDLLALGLANLASGLFQGSPVGAGYSASAANAAAGAQSKAAGWVACAAVALVVALLLPQLAHTPQPVLAAIVIYAVGRTLNMQGIAPYFRWQRDRLVALAAVLAVLWMGVLDGLLAAVAVSLLMLLRGLATPRLSWLGQFNGGREYVDAALHPEAVTPPRLLIARPEVPLFFGNANTVTLAIREAVAKAHAREPAHTVILSLEESPDLDGSAVEALLELAGHLRRQNVRLVLARAKDRVRHLLNRVNSPDLPPAAYSAWSVDAAVQQALNGVEH
jgi:MFS superfamily sulfate permease-like transporter